MSFVLDIIDVVIDFIVKIVEFVVQIVELIIHVISVILGHKPDGQIVEYYEVENFPLFNNNDRNNPITNVILESLLTGSDLAGELIYYSAFRDGKADFRGFMRFIDDGNYFEPLPTIESYIVVVDYNEIADTLSGIHGEATTTERAATDALSNTEWIQYWLQENKIYDVGANELGEGTASTSTSPGTPAADGFVVTPSTNHFEVDITSEAVTSDAMDASQVWNVLFGTIVYNSGPDNYNVDATNGFTTITLPYTIPTKPLQLHYIVYYHVNSNPSLELLFVYKVGEGTYPDLDTVETPIDLDGTLLEVVPAVPLRISNTNFTSFGATKAQQIEDACAIVHLDPQELLDSVLNDPDVAPGDIDNIYLNFGVRLKDTSAVAIEYLFNMCENLFPTQAVTRALYDSTPSVDTKPVNTIIVTTEDNKAVFQFNYITFKFTTLFDIDADTGSVENGIYYSDMSKFNDAGILRYPYFISSAKGTYNVRYKADTLAEVANFLAGSGTINPGIVTGEAANWLQVTTRMTYNNPSPVLLDPDDNTSTIIYLTPDRVYENNGSGILRAVLQAAEETTSGQSITYYEATISGLNAYTMAAPIGALRVIDGDSGRFNMVKFNLGGEKEIMAPLIHTFINARSKTDVTKLFLGGAHLSIYIARYEVIEPVGLSLLEAVIILVLIIVVIVVVVYTAGAALAAAAAFISALATASLIVAAAIVLKALVAIAIIMILQYLLKQAVISIAKKDVALAIIVGIIGSLAIAAFSAGGISDMTTLDLAVAGLNAMELGNKVFEVRDQQIAEELGIEQEDFDREARERDKILLGKVDALADIEEEIFGPGTKGTFDLVNTSLRASTNGMYAEHIYSLSDNAAEIPLMLYEIEVLMDMQITTEGTFV